MFTSIINTVTGTATIGTALLCTGVSIALGLIISYIYMSQERYSKNMAISLVVLPALVQIIIMMVNGNLGTGVAVLGAFSLIRFRSVPGSSKDICIIFFAMAIGLATGMGCLTFAALITVILGLTIFVLNKIKFGEGKGQNRNLKIIIPEDLDYTEIFDDIFEKYTNNVQLDKIKTTNLGSMYELTYSIVPKKDINEKSFIDEIRCRNGNLTVNLSRAEVQKDEL